MTSPSSPVSGSRDCLHGSVAVWAVLVTSGRSQENSLGGGGGGVGRGERM